MRNHKVAVYTRAGVLAHVQSTNGEEWPADIEEYQSDGTPVPLVRIDVELEPTAREIADGDVDKPAPRRASVLFNRQLEVVGGKVRYRSGEGGGGAIIDRAAAVLPT
jgi:hypothetical protein